MIEIKEVKTKKELKAFVKFPLELYRDNKYFVPPILSDEIKTLRKDKNPAFEFCEARYWMAYSDNKIVGRIAGILNYKSNEIWQQKHVRFGWIDFIDDVAVSKALFQIVEDWGRQLGMTHIHGPLGFCDLDKEGMLVEGFGELSMMHSYYNYPYYPYHLDSLGFVKDVDWVEFQKPNLTFPEDLMRIVSVYKNKLQNYSAIDIKTPKDVFKYKIKIIELINCAYKSLYGFVPINEKIFDHYFKKLFLFTNLDYVSVIKNTKNQVVGFGLAMPLLSKTLRKTGGRLFPFGFIQNLKAFRKNDSVTLLLIAVHPDLQSKGIPLLIIEEINSNFLGNGIKTVEVSHMLESNTSIQNLWKHFNARQHKRRRCYIKELTFDAPCHYKKRS